MRNIVNLNFKWAFSKEAETVPASMPEKWYWVNLPHTWNAIDGQDGNNDLYRGAAYYAKNVDKIDIPDAQRYYLEINGANSSAAVYWNGKKLAIHDGGYSIWRVDVTDVMESSNLIVFEVDNAPNDRVYPQSADFTFYGGLYRDVNLICVPESHFDLSYYGGPGIKVTPIVEGSAANVEVEVWTKNADGKTLTYTITDAEGNVVAETATTETKANFVIENAHKWHGRKDPYLYTATVKLEDLDTVSARFGCRSFEIDPDRGFILNGEEYPLRGVARHQDRWCIGNALLPEHHEEDIDMIMELGATTIRLAHYQHDQYTYDLCDEKGLILWAEIPYISQHLPGGVDNTVNQMKELIIQNYNHPSIVVWGLSNEVTSEGADPRIDDNHKILNDLCHGLDKTRPTTMAVVSMCPTNHPYIQIPDVVSYNHYFGWYGGTIDAYGPWFDKFHADHPSIPIGVSEYGCEALNWHNSEPEAGDYTEEYQAIYHEALIKQLFTRKYLWATHVWNMFDFGADGRNEGGESGQNHKGLVTFDRKYKKDSFYAYKAWLSDEPFVHLCGKRYVDRTEDVTKVTVYSNLPSVELFANGISLGVKEAPDHFFYFDVPNVGETKLVAVAGQHKDESVIRKVAEPNPAYRLVEKGAILNWWDITEVPGHASLNTKVEKIIASIGVDTLTEMLRPIVQMSAVPSVIALLSTMTVIRQINLLTGATNTPVTKEQLLDLNAQLNKIAI
ncbi:MAG: glycoside hydrolase family 2 TIM barrel-domain containing protein [Oscillospiraceae bacterium]|nr:glycoside hydrolase family 2 TIM barrel-domain containing protein [Oscillospiraceae bacterium]